MVLATVQISDEKDSDSLDSNRASGEAGIQGFEAYEAADRANLQVVGGECPTVGLAGGYTDQVLEWKAIDGQGKMRTARRDNENSDLFWALSGGGGGTYAVVYEMTSNAHPGTPVSGLHLSFDNTNISQDAFYEAISIFHANLPALVDAGAMSIWFYTNTTFAISPLTGPNIPKAELISLLQPFLEALNRISIHYTMRASQYSSYYNQFKGEQGTIGVGEAQYGGWLIPRYLVEDSNEEVTKAYREITENGGTFIGVGLNVSHEVAGDVYNSVLLAWRETIIATTLTTPWKWGSENYEEMVALQLKMTEIFMPKLEAIAPHSGAYMNEGDFRQPDWQKAFYGRNYRTLRTIKAKYDPNDVFFGKTAVGTDEWVERQDGRLCRVSQWQVDWLQFGSQ
ncbi:FAD-binding type 2 [Penicillium waksmanii]|uniref:FAD-binding type 2 n=1 Tax=Penicillium waksmanii TaxID=69791 RepID=UPI002547B062|nr:FAD-binding type 2 [Penicillium waksmanii]KAJ5980880.1 FAD-binding type 2 [Penicillium waksmanii]